MSITREVIGTKIWCSGGSDPGDRTEPDSADIVAGWGEGKPERQYFNWLDFVQHNNLAFFEQAGFYEWDTSITYEQYAIVRATDGILYISIVDDNSANDPSGGTDTTNWENFGNFLSRNSTSVNHVQVISSGTSVTLSPGIYDIYCIGAGGGGGAGNTNETNMDGHGGGGGACVYERLSVDTTTTYTISIGAGGTGGVAGLAATASGSDGGTTTFSTLSAAGGLGGDYGHAADVDVGYGGEGGDADDCSGGDITWSGSSGSLAYARAAASTSNCVAGYGGAAGGPMGGGSGGSGNYSFNNGDTDTGNDSQYGSGGRGGNLGDDGLDGADGVIFIVGV